MYALAAEGRVVALENMEDLPKTIETARRMVIRSGEVSRIPGIVAGKISEMLSSKNER